MDRQELLARYEAEMRRAAWVPGLPAQQLPDITRYYDAEQREVLIMWHRFAAQDAERVVERERAFFMRGLDLSWEIYADDEPANLKSVLRSHGLESQGEDTLMVCAVDALLASGPAPAADLRTLHNAQDIAQMGEVWESVWPGESGGWLKVLGEALTVEPERIKVLVACVDNAPVASGYIVIDPRGTFAYLGGGASREGFRGRGLYRSLVLARARLAAAANIRYLAVEASDESRPVLARQGFMPITTLQFFELTKRA